MVTVMVMVVVVMGANNAIKSGLGFRRNLEVKKPGDDAGEFRGQIFFSTDLPKVWASDVRWNYEPARKLGFFGRRRPGVGSRTAMASRRMGAHRARKPAPL